MNIKILLATAAIVTGSLAAQAQVIIYKLKGTVKTTGGYAGISKPISGYFVYECSNGNLTGIYAFPKQAAYKIDGNWKVSTAIGQNGADITAYSQGTSYFDSTNQLHMTGIMATGRNASVNIGRANPWRTPRTLSLLGRSVYPLQTGGMAIEETTATLTIDLNDTQDYNTSPFTVDQIFAFLLQNYMGWTQL